MSDHNPVDGGPAFPHAVVMGDRAVTQGGMSLRDWFAGQALLGILSGPAARPVVLVDEWYDAPRHAYGIADAMLDERLKDRAPR